MLFFQQNKMESAPPGGSSGSGGSSDHVIGLKGEGMSIKTPVT